MAPSVQEPLDITFDVTALREVLARIAINMVLLHRGLERDARRETQNASLPASELIAQQFAESMQLLRYMEEDVRTLWVKPEPTEPRGGDPGPPVSPAGTRPASNTAAGGAGSAGGNRSFRCPHCEEIITVG
jgi:hypothetical protein